MVLFRHRLAASTACVAIFCASALARAEDVSAEAKKHFSAGVNLLRDPQKPRYEEAYREFKTAYRLSASPKILGNLGLSAMMLERDSEAIDAYTKYLASTEIKLDKEQRAQIERDIATLKAGLVYVNVSTKPGGAVLVDQRVPSSGESITNVYPQVNGTLRIGMRQGHHVMRARVPGRPEAVWELDATAGDTEESHVFLIPEPPPVEAVHLDGAESRVQWERPVPTGTIISGGAAIGFGIGTVITGLLAIDARNSYNDRNNGFQPESAESAHKRAQTWNVVSDVALGATIVSAAVATYFFVTRPSIARRGSASPLVVTF